VTRVRALRPCGSGSCVSTQTPGTDPLRRIEPLAFSGPPEAVLQAVLRVLGRLPRLRILERDDISVHAVMRSSVLRVPLDIDVVVDAVGGRIHLRAWTPLALRERAASRPRALELMRTIERELRQAA